MQRYQIKKFDFLNLGIYNSIKSVIYLTDSKTDKKDRFGGLFLLPKIGKNKLGEFSNFTNRNSIISQTELQTENHHQSTEFSKFPNNRKLQFNEQNYNQITSRNAIRSQTERKKKRKEKKEAKKRIRVKERY